MESIVSYYSTKTVLCGNPFLVHWFLDEDSSSSCNREGTHSCNLGLDVFLSMGYTLVSPLSYTLL